MNLGYVLNVNEDPAERLESLVDAYRHTKRVLVVSTQTESDPLKPPPRRGKMITAQGQRRPSVVLLTEEAGTSAALG